MTQGTAAKPALGYFLAWNLVGVGCLLGLLTLLTIGFIVLPITMALLLILVLRPSSYNASAIGAVAGVGEVALYIGFLNRGGPGEVCNRAGTACITEWSPWPWVAVGSVLIAASIVGFGYLRARF
ncbi:hypothetical protein ACSMXN_02390 [Jatrophihabitans sp. DSM 45814]